MENHTVRNNMLQNAGWKLGRTSLANMGQLRTTHPDLQNTTLLVSMPSDMSSSDGAGFLQQKRSTSHCSCCCRCSCYCCS